MTVTRSVDHATNAAIERARVHPWWSRYSVPLRCTFPVANMPLDFEHRLEAIPDGFLVVFADASITAQPGIAWTPALAFLQADTDHAHATIIFYTLREETQDA